MVRCRRDCESCTSTVSSCLRQRHSWIYCIPSFFKSSLLLSSLGTPGWKLFSILACQSRRDSLHVSGASRSHTGGQVRIITALIKNFPSSQKEKPKLNSAWRIIKTWPFHWQCCTADACCSSVWPVKRVVWGQRTQRSARGTGGWNRIAGLWQPVAPRGPLTVDQRMTC